MRIIKPGTNIPFIPNRKIFFIVSSVLIIISLTSIFTKGINFGIDFAGGYEFQVQFPKAVDVATVKKTLRTLKMGEPVVQQFGALENHEYLIRIKKSHSADSKILENVKKELTDKLGKENIRGFHYSAESGERVQIELTNATDSEEIKKVFVENGMGVQSISTSARQDKPLFTVNLTSVSKKAEDLLRKEFSINDDKQLIERVEFVGPQVGQQLRNQGIMAILYAMVFILLYIAIRFDFFFSPGAVAALLHDVIITVGIFSIFGIEFNLPIIAALLTIVGYSLNDTIVVYDRIRENVNKLRGREITNLVNTSINDTLSRTLLTSVTTLLVVTALLFYGGGIIRDFSLALFIGVLIGTYSSVAVASPMYIVLRESFGKKKSS